MSTENKQPKKQKLSKSEIISRVYKNIERTYSSEKGKKFITHLILEFIPESKINVVRDASLKDLKCCLTNVPLTVCMSDEKESNIMECIIIGIINPPYGDLVIDEADKKSIGSLVDTKVALMVEGSSKYISPLAYVMFRNFILNEITHGNKHLNFFITKAREKQMFDKLPKEAQKELTDKNEQDNKVKSHLVGNYKPQTYALSDNEALQKLMKDYGK